jgi:hypothetical protein
MGSLKIDVALKADTKGKVFQEVISKQFIHIFYLVSVQNTFLKILQFKFSSRMSF